jgi:hypothetical protein
MQTVAECEQAAAECRRLAAQIKDPQQKTQMEDMAELWEKLARERRRGIVENKPDQARSEPEELQRGERGKRA